MRRRKMIAKMKQKALGLTLASVGIASVPVLDMDGTAALLIVPMGLYLLFCSRIWIDY